MPRRFMTFTGRNSTTETPPESGNVDSDFIVILAAFLCAIICVLGLLAVARCTWIRRISGIIIISRHHPSLTAVANKGLKKKVLNTLPKITYSPDTMAETVFDCAICLTEFVSGDQIRVLPRCGHGFHVACIDTWFGSHSSCPSCRQILAPVSRCKKCGEVSVVEPPVSQVMTAGETDGSVNRFLP